MGPSTKAVITYLDSMPPITSPHLIINSARPTGVCEDLSRPVDYILGMSWVP
jgi:hypothetical protein